MSNHGPHTSQGSAGSLSPSCAEALEHLQPWEGPAVLLVDLDAFFASVEQRDHPGWRGRPVIVGGDPDKRGVVSTASYEARAFGVHSAMASSVARELCPDAIWTRGDHGHYEEVSAQIMAILADQTPFMQQVSIDEAFLDVTPTRANPEHPVQVAARIQQRVRDEVGVTCSVGVGSTKTVAKVASDVNKPFGVTVVYPGHEREFLAPLPIRKMSGVGAASEARLRKFGIATLADLAAADESVLRSVFGKNAGLMRQRALGGEASPVCSDDDVKSVSHETSFAVDLRERDQILRAAQTMAGKVGRRLRAQGLCCGTVVLKLRHGDRTLHSAQQALDAPTNDDLALRAVLDRLLNQVWQPGRSVRLVGVAATRLRTVDEAAAEPVQQALFDLDAPDAGGEGEGGHAGSSAGPRALASDRKRAQLLSAADAVRDRFGDDGLRFGFELRSSGNSTGTQPM
ncbi:MAG: DNA polymerase IV [Coriobacteriia bacterium]|nr:DNA polymerase IV [Coriobacteriia bacterium]